MSIDFSNLPELPLDDLTYAVDLFDGFDHSTEPTSISAAHDFGQASSGHQAPLEPLEGSIPEVSTSAGRLTTSDNRQHLNKLAQKRFRERQRVRASTLEAQLDQISTQLRELQDVQTRLQTRNILLEKLVELNKQAGPPSGPSVLPDNATVTDLYRSRGFKAVPDPLLAMTRNVSALSLTVRRDVAQLIPVQDVGKLSLREFAKIYTAYTHQMAACLAEDSGDSSPAMRRLQQLTDECWTLIVIIGLTHVSGVKDLQDCNMGEGVACPDAKQPEFYCAIMATMQHSDPQIQDLLYLRQLFYGKLGQLARERTALLSHMTCYKIDESHVSDKVTQLTQWSEQLRENAAEEHQSYKQFSSAFYRGIHTSKQLAVAQVCGFPWLPAVNKMLEAEAVRRGEPPMRTLLEDTTLDDLENAANWAEVATYLTTITVQDLNLYVPLIQRQG
ncbi:TPA: hypothetical protein ACH3X3_013360 [Trebouxia sp. C0006]